MKNIYEAIKNKLIALTILLLIHVHAGLGQTTFTSSDLDLKGNKAGLPTSLQFGKDNTLYVAQWDGTIRVFKIKKNAANSYEVLSAETIELIKKMPNYNDDGTYFPPGTNSTKRQITGILVDGDATDPIVYVSSSDYRFGAGSHGDVNLCTNSGVISKLYKQGGVWKKIDLVRGLPRSEENHSPNGMQLSEDKKTLLIGIGGFTNAGGISTAWTYITEYALSAAILAVDLEAIEAMPTKTDLRPGVGADNANYKYDLPTLDDPTRANLPDGSDPGDPWGGNDGMNQAMIVPGGPVQIFASGFRNPYDVLISKHPGRKGRVYTIDNASNRNWGGWPKNEGTDGTVTNEYVTGEPGTGTVGNVDGLFFIGDMDTYTYGSYYGGHPNPIRANPSGAGLYTDNGTYKGWRNDNSNPNLPLPSDWPPVKTAADPKQGNYINPGTETSAPEGAHPALLYWGTSVNGLCEYLYTGNEFYGDLFAAPYDAGGNIFHINMDDSHNVINQTSTGANNRLNTEPPIFTGFGDKPLDVIAQGDDDPFPGTIWVACYGASKIVVFEPSTIPCPAILPPTQDYDQDGFTNKDEQDNETNPCSASSKPNDNDGDNISDMNDNDDDNDGILDVEDYYAIDKYNGDTINIPTHYSLHNFDPGVGFFGLGFTGLMCNGVTDYRTQYNPGNMVSGGAAGAVTVEEVPAGDALGNLNTQQYAFQFGVNISESTGSFNVKAGLLPQYFNLETPVNNMSQGAFIGTGDQDNYIKIVLHSNSGAGGIQVVHEINGAAITYPMVPLPSGIPNEEITFFFVVDLDAKLLYPKFSIGDGAVQSAANPIPLTGKLLDYMEDTDHSVAVGIIATSKDAGKPFNATWDFIEVNSGLNITATKKMLSNEGNINIFPNPGKDEISININSEINDIYKIRIFNSLGREIIKTEVSHQPGLGDYPMNVAELSEGIYYIQFASEKENLSSTIKFIKK